MVVVAPLAPAELDAVVAVAGEEIWTVVFLEKETLVAWKLAVAPQHRAAELAVGEDVVVAGVVRIGHIVVDSAVVELASVPVACAAASREDVEEERRCQVDI